MVMISNLSSALISYNNRQILLNRNRLSLCKRQAMVTSKAIAVFKWKCIRSDTMSALMMESGVKRHILTAGMAKVSDSRGGSSYKDLGLSLGGV